MAANLKRHSIELVKNPEEAMNGGEVELQKYWTAPFLPWRVTREAIQLMSRLENNDNENKELDMLDEMAAFVADRIYQGQFTVEDLFDRLHAPDANATIIRQVQFIANGSQEANSKN
jgi:hypothetical protein